MSDWRPTCTVETARRRAALLAQARAHFAARGVLEVETPMLSPAAVTDPHIESVEARLELDRARPRWLRTSPEFAMKRLLAAGFPDIFEIGRVFRDGERGARHQPEFTLVEWYRHGFGLAEIVADTVAFVSALVPRRLLAREAEALDYREAFRRHAGLDPFAAPVSALAEAAGADRPLRDALGDHRDGWLDLVLATRVVPRFGKDRLTVLQHYPATQAALARLCPQDAARADRFEVFFGELELANGFVELADAAEQAARFAADQARRRAAGLPLRPVDARLLAALAAGLPPCAGVAVGFDRLAMIGEMTEDIRRVQTFAFEDPA
ncbi:MAG TPA: EF-P lysine aminoacylase EpmA [Gammaproteobacteria bacterium]